MIDNIVKGGLCTNCGSCFSVCPNNAIDFKKSDNNFLFRSKKDKCLKCGLCLKVCPGVGLDEKKLDKFDMIKNILRK